MKQVGVRELKSRLSDYLALVKAAEEVVVRERKHGRGEVGRFIFVADPAPALIRDGWAGSYASVVRAATGPIPGVS